MQNMDEDMKNLIAAADIRPKWRVVKRTMARRKPVNGIQLGYIQAGFVFYSAWWKDGWISITSNKWILLSACEQVVEQPTDPPMQGNLYQLLGDVELPEEYRKNGIRNNVPQTVKFIHDGNTSIRYTDELIAFMMSLNPGMSRKTFEGICDSYNRQNEKFRNGERKYPYELGFAYNTHMAKRRFIWGGGLQVAPGTVMIEFEVIHPDLLPDPATIAKSPYAIYLNTIANGRTNPYPNGAKPLFALVSPYPLYIQAERCRPVTTLVRPYDV